ncbi:hypothetical protein TPHA_0G03720 [Tetrapisispora phaffii CBS 4417]|uniref:RNA helicase n=1 Tax=Tetrapisispora phaffii (strain ATCC 24235 / CBS 4417 / NBRC 1672 / NRRL Y-8282 / UCD 70-5) TaxID=1071381 RepID=G8BWD4_TETPH|nr:hypothetical protein TPHA_0G03720 [Tetrapisispora phaffii CBS 4417]CCE64212.1 hypothetical protein TPHA_0G03720 [Tetrapisispora phaffii CBS 4417]
MDRNSLEYKKRASENSRPWFNVGIVHNKLLDDDLNTYNNDKLELSDDDDYLGDKRSLFSSVINDNSGMSVSEKESGARQRKKIRIKKTSDNTVNCDSNLVSTEVLPDRFKTVFDFSLFNKMQSACFNQLYNETENCVISAPTGSGKTVLFELAILNLVKNNNFELGNIKVLYIAPTKSLCYEKLKSWNSKFVDLRIGMLTGDTSQLEVENVRKSNVIITTPEKWDQLTRKWEDYSRLFDLIKLILVDEIHILKDNRGAILEVVLTRMNYRYPDIRIVAVSATIPNINDIAVWLKSNVNRQNPALVLDFDDSYRQVALKKYVYGIFSSNKNDYQKDAFYNSKLDEVFYNHGKKKPILIFCPTRSSTASTAKYIGHESRYMEEMSVNKKSVIFDDHTLNECYNNGVLFHHAGLSLEDRRLVEETYLDGTIKILCSTTTLAVGINLPAYLVIIKGTKMWSISGNDEYSELDILQMLGRAGRPQYENEGCAVILTDTTKKEKYSNLINGCENLESRLHLNLLEHLCAEISLKTCHSLDSFIEWLKSTFFYVRYLKAPAKYPQVHKYFRPSDKNSEFQLQEFCKTLLRKLEDNNIIFQTDGTYECTSHGISLVRHYVMFDTITKFVFVTSNLSLSDVLSLLSKAEEFKGIRLRHNEKRLYKEINSSPLTKFPFLTENKQAQIISQGFQKVSLLLQYEFGGLEFPKYEGSLKLHQILVQDKMKALKDSYRIIKSMIDIFISKKDGISLRNALFLLRCLNGNCWDNTPMTLRQIKNVGLVSVRKLLSHGIHSLKDVLTLSESQVEYYLNLNPGAGTKILRDVALIPKIELDVQVVESSINKENNGIYACFRVELSCDYKTAVWHGKRLSIDILTIKQDGSFLDFRRIGIEQLKHPRSYKLECILNTSCEKISFAANCQEISGIGKMVEFNGTLLFKNHFSNKNKMTFLENIMNEVNDSNELDAIPLSSDDSLINYLDTSKNRETGKASSPKNTLYEDTKNPRTEREVLLNGNLACQHSCKDKMTCRHICCRGGIPPNAVRRKRGDKVHTLKVEQNSNQNLNNKTAQIEKEMLTDYLQNQYHSNGTLMSNSYHSPEINSIIHEKSLPSVVTTPIKVERTITTILSTSSPSSPTPCSSSQEMTDASNNGLNFLGSDVQFQ